MNIGPGRPRGARGDAKERIQASAARRFLERGYAGTTLRAVAVDCGVDVALVSYYFGSKRKLFAAALELTANPADVLAGAVRDGPPSAGRILAAVIMTWEDPDTGAPLRALVQRALAEESTRALLTEYLESELAPALRRALTGARRDSRARAAVYVLAGAVLGHYALGIDAGAGPEQLFDDLLRPFAAALARP